MGWFSSKTNGMPDFGQGSGYKPSSFTTRKKVPVSKLVSTNRGGYLSKNKVAKYAKGGGGDPLVVEHRGKYYVADGHHRAAAAMARGESHITVRSRKA